MKKKIDPLLLIGYCFVLLLECAALYKSRFHYYEVTRLLTSIILLVYVFKRKELKFIRLYFYIGLSFVVLADILTLFFSDFWFHAGLSLFTFSYLSFAAIYFRYRQIKERKNVPPVLSVLAILLTILMALNFFLPEIKDILTDSLILVHGLVICIILVWAIKGNRRTIGKNYYFLPSAILIVLANLCYLVDVNLFLRKYVLLDISVIFFHGVYLLLLSKAVNDYKKVQTSDVRKHQSDTSLKG